MRNYPELGVQIPDVYLPRKNINLSKWAVIACDQFTSEPEYWKKAEEFVGESPSTLNLIFPEVYLGKPGEDEKLTRIQNCMKSYMGENILESREGLILVKREAAGKTRWGVVLALDLEKYDFNKGSQSLIRATEGTIIDRLPPRIKVREGASLELPHILVLIDDPEKTVIEPLSKKIDELEKIYDFELMLGSGHLNGYSVQDPALEEQFIKALKGLADPLIFKKKYNLEDDQGILLFAMGDGNHSLATAKAIWENNKEKVGMEHPSRYALVEIENVHDEGLDFEPIHRIAFDNSADIVEGLQTFFKDRLTILPCSDEDEMIEKVHQQEKGTHLVGFIHEKGAYLLKVASPDSNLPAGTIQDFLNNWNDQNNVREIDYVHGNEATFKHGKTAGNASFYLPPMDKSDLFKTVILDGALPRKTFSMGEAIEKRFYFESRKIT